MVLVSVDIAQEKDDAQINADTNSYFNTWVSGQSTFYLSYNRFSTGSDPNNNKFGGRRGFYLFKGITIPQGSTIDNATLTLPNVQNSGTVVFTGTVKGVNQTTPTLPTTNNTNNTAGAVWFKPVGTAVNTFTVVAGFGTSAGSPTMATDVGVDVKTVVQELVNNFNYSNQQLMLRVGGKAVPTTITANRGNILAEGLYEINPPTSIVNLTINYTPITAGKATINAILSGLVVTTVELETPSVSPSTQTTTLVDALIQVVNGQCGVDLTDLNVYYTFDEAGGTLINNATAIGSVDAIPSTNGTVGASVTRSITGQVSDGYESNGDVPSQSANRISLLSSNISDFDFMINDGEVYTVNLWINTTVTPTVQGFGEMLVNQNNTGGSRGFLFSLAGDDGFGKNLWRVRPREGGDIIDISTIPNASNGGSFSSFEWHMLTAVVDIDAQTADYYLDGRFKVQAGAGVASSPFSGSGDTQMQLNSITIAQAGRSLLAKIDEYSIWRRGLSSNEIRQLYALNSGGTPLQDSNGGAVCFTVDSILLTPPFMTHLFEIDACVGIFAGRRSDIGALIVKVLVANPAGLTGLQIVDEVRLLRPTSKTSRIKNWIGFLRNRGIIVDDGSSPDWYRTVWTVV